MDRGVGTDQMIEGEQMGVAELHNTLGVGAHGSDIATELVPGEDDGDRHHTLQRASRPSASAPGWLDRPRGAGRPASETDRYAGKHSSSAIGVTWP